MSAVRNMILSLTADASNYSKGMKAAATETKVMKKELELWALQNKKTSDSAAYLSKSTQMLKDQQPVLAKQIELTNARLKDQITRFGETSSQATTAKSKLLDLQIQQEKLNASIKAQPNATIAGIKNAGQGMVNVGNNMSMGVTAPIMAAGAGVYKIGENYETAYNRIRGQTGATGEKFAGLEESFKKVYAQTGATSDQVSMAITDLTKRTNLAGTALENLTLQEIRLSKITGEDLKTQIQLTTRMFGDWNVEVNKQPQALDNLLKVYQVTGVSVSQLAEKVVFFGAPLRSMGFSFEQAAGMIGKFEKEGVNTELVLTSLRKAASTMAKNGVTDLVAGFTGAVEAIKNTKSETKALTMATEVFGAKSANDMMRAIRENRFELQDLFKELQGNKDSIKDAASDTATFAGKLTKLRHEIENAIEPLGGSFVSAMQDAIPYIKTAVMQVTDLINKFNALPSSTKTATIGFLGIAATVGPALSSLGYMTLGISTLATTSMKVFPMIASSAMWLAGGFTQAFGAIATSFQVAAAGEATFGAAFMAAMGPAGWVALGITAIGGLTLAFMAHKNAISDTQKEYNVLSSATAKQNQEIDNQANASMGSAVILNKEAQELESLAIKTNKSAAEKSRMVSIVGDLNAALPNLALNINQETGALGSQISTIYDAIDAYKQLILVKAAEKKAEAAGARLLDAQTKIDEEKKKSSEITYTRPAGKYEPSKPIFYFSGDDYNHFNETVAVNQKIVDESNKIINDAFNLRKAYDEKNGQKYKTDLPLIHSFGNGNSESPFKEEQKKAVDALANAVDGYKSKLDSAIESTLKFIGTFDKFESKSQSLGSMIRNMQKNMTTMRDYFYNMKTLEGRGLSAGVLATLYDKGVGASGEVKRLTGASDEQISSINQTYADQKYFASQIGYNKLGANGGVNTYALSIHGKDITDNEIVEMIFALLRSRGISLDPA